MDSETRIMFSSESRIGDKSASEVLEIVFTGDGTEDDREYVIKELIDHMIDIHKVEELKD